jgi:threonine/homoserine/homoserine lactone efflux protein
MMPDTTHLIAFSAIACVVLATPGPNFVYILTRGATQCRRAAFMAAVGLGCGALIHTMLAAAGISALVRSSYVVFQLVKYGGSAYLIILGVCVIASRAPLIRAEAPTARNGQIVWQSIVASMTNPKTILFFLSFLPQFVAPGSAVASQLLVFGGLYALLTVIVYSAVGGLAGVIGLALRSQPIVASRLRWIAGGSFVGLGVWAALPARR